MRESQDDTKRMHCPPYKEMARGPRRDSQDPADYLAPGVENFYELAGSCQCTCPGSKEKCFGAIMLRSKGLPWTHFPKMGGGMFNLQTGWTNPVPLRNPAQVKSKVGLFLVQDGAGKMVPKMADKSETARWDKFWYAADMLYRWATREKVVKDGKMCEFELDDEKVKVYTAAFNKCYTASVVEQYQGAGLLAPETFDDWSLFRYCRNDDLILTKAERDKLMHQLLDERRKLVDMLEKMEFVRKISNFGVYTLGRAADQSIVRMPDIFGTFDPRYNFMYSRELDYKRLEEMRKINQQNAAAMMAVISNGEPEPAQQRQDVRGRETEDDQEKKRRQLLAVRADKDKEQAGAAEKQQDVRGPETEDEKENKRRKILDEKAEYARKRRAAAKGEMIVSGGKNKKLEHCPPYTPYHVDAFFAILPCLRRALEFYELLGKCVCVTDCPGLYMVKCKCTPWTRFPTENGMFLEASWENPKPIRNNKQMLDDMQKFLGLAQDASAKMLPNYRGVENEAKWEKFWYAVNALYNWCIGTDSTDRSLVDTWTTVFVKNKQRGIMCQKYEEAGLLGQETIEDWVRFRDCRNDDMRLDSDAKDDLMHILLVERRRAVDLFEKMLFIDGIVKQSPSYDTMRRWSDEQKTKHLQQQIESMRRLSDAERQAHIEEQKKSWAAKIRDQNAAADAMKTIRQQEKAAQDSLLVMGDAGEAEQAAQALLGLRDTSRAGGAGGAARGTGARSVDTCALLKCLERLALEE